MSMTINITINIIIYSPFLNDLIILFCESPSLNSGSATRHVAASAGQVDAAEAADPFHRKSQSKKWRMTGGTMTQETNTGSSLWKPPNGLVSPRLGKPAPNMGKLVV